LNNAAFEKYEEYNQNAIAWKQFWEGTTKKSNSTHRHISHLKKLQCMIDHNKSSHAMQIQRSRFIAIDEDISNKNLLRMSTEFLAT